MAYRYFSGIIKRRYSTTLTNGGKNQEEDKVTILTGYSLGKAQRLIQGIDPSIGKIFTHGAIEKTNEIIRNMGVKLNQTTYVNSEISKSAYRGALIIAPPSALGTSWQKNFNLSKLAMLPVG